METSCWWKETNIYPIYSKAFDSLCHSLKIKKLEEFEIEIEILKES